MPPNSAHAPKQCRTCSDKFRSSVAFQSSFLKGLALLYFRLKSACSFALRFTLLTQIMDKNLTWQLRSTLARASYVVLFDLKPLTEDGNLQVYMYCLHAHKKKTQEPPEHTSEHVKSQNFLGECPQTPLTQSILWGPTSCICPGPTPILSAALVAMYLSGCQNRSCDW